jgi:hypothetical protein
MGVNHPFVEASNLTTVGKFVPHATSPEKKRQVKGVEGGRCEGDQRKRSEELWKKIQGER